MVAAPAIKIKLVKDDIGGVQLATERGELLSNVFVKQYTRVEDSVMKLDLEVVFLVKDEEMRNW